MKRKLSAAVRWVVRKKLVLVIVKHCWKTFLKHSMALYSLTKGWQQLNIFCI